MKLRFLFPVLSAFVSLSLFILGAELLTRWGGYSGQFAENGLFFPEKKSFDFDWWEKEERDPVATYNRLRQQEIKSGEKVFINDVEFSVEKPPGVKRILFIGDSGTFGYGVKEAETFVALIRSSLPKEKYEVINAGIPGFSPIDSFSLLKEVLYKFQPDSVIYGFFLANDINDLIYYRYRKVQKDSQGLSHRLPWLKKSALFNFAKIQWTKLQEKYHGKDQSKSFEILSLTDEHGVSLDHNFCSGRYSSYKKELPRSLVQSWKIMEDQLYQVDNFVRSIGGIFSILIIPSHTTVSGKFLFTQGFDHVTCLRKAGVAFNESDIEPQAPLNRFLDICKRKDFLCMNPNEKIQQELGLKFFRYGDDHESVEGHRLLADLLLTHQSQRLP